MCMLSFYLFSHKNLVLGPPFTFIPFERLNYASSWHCLVEIFSFFFICVCVCMYLLMWVNINRNLPVEVRGQAWSVCPCHPPWLRWGFLLFTARYVRLSVLWVLEILLSPLPTSPQQCIAHFPYNAWFYLGSGSPVSGPQSHKASTSSPEPFSFRLFTYTLLFSIMLPISKMLFWLIVLP